MKLLTFYMGVEVTADRLDALGHVVRVKRPEFIALQNVTNENIKKVLAAPWATHYTAIQPPYKFETRKKPTVAILSSYPATDPKTLKYHETATDRMLQRGYYVMYDKQNKPFVICVATTTLEEGLKVSELREKQLNEACLSMVDDVDAFLLGNLCLDDDIDGEILLQGGWMDAWLSIPGNTQSNGFTYNPDKNPLIKEDPFGPGRPDRVLFKSKHYKLDSVELVGVEPVQLSGGTGVTISNHYGLFVQLSPLELDEAAPKAKPSIVSAIFKRTEWSVQFQQNSQ